MDCGSCNKYKCAETEKGHCVKMTWEQLLMALFLPAVLFSLSLFVSRKLGVFAQSKPVMSCMTRAEVDSKTTSRSKCLTIYDGSVYDFTTAKKWDITGHVGKHLCGKEYDKATIENGPHPVSVMDKFLTNKLCIVGEVPSTLSQTGNNGGGSIWPKTILGMSWFRFSAYLSLFFFVFNFLTCFAMPWAGVKEPWEGDHPGKDKNDQIGKFPLTHMHKLFAWLAIFALSWHGVLGFAGILFGKWF